MRKNFPILQLNFCLTLSACISH